jgi:hypothetical protein
MIQSSILRPRRRACGVALGLAAAGAVAAGAVAVDVAQAGSPAAKRTTIVQRFYSHQVSFVFTKADGKVVAGPPQGPPAAGDRIEFTELAYPGNHKHHAKRWTMTSHTICVFQAHGGPICDGQGAVGGGQMLLFHTDDATGTRVTGGTGRYARATGRVAMREIRKTNASDIVLTLQLSR